MDDADWDEWMRMTDAEQDAIKREEAAYFRMLDRMTLRERVAHHRRISLESCLRWRKAIHEHRFDFMRKYHRESQIRLLKLRIWRATGSYPGEA